ncbi:MAG: ABC transporter ATP-binding protein [Chloroflexi bacterium]|nr:ABC transporter ATP-binding protein [Chloroflexota bacterium]
MLTDVSLHLEAGQLAMLVGQNGAGKSTLLRCIAGWSLSERGKISANGASLHHQEQTFRRQVVLVPDTPDFYDELTAWEHLQFVAQLHRLRDWETEATALLSDFQLLDRRDTFPFTFSRGMRLKLALCLALLVHPPLLLLDEPFAPLDAVSNHVLWQKLAAYAAAGNTVLFSSHTVPGGSLPDVVFFLDQGQIENIPPTESLNLVELLGEGDDAP